MTVVTSFPGSITHAEQLGGGSGKHASDCRRRRALALALLRQYTETTNYERDKWIIAFLDRVPEQLNVSFYWYILAIEGKRLPSYVVHVEGKRWTISHGFAVTITTAATMANVVLATSPSVCAMENASMCGCCTAGPVKHGFRSGKGHRSLAPSWRRPRWSLCSTTSPRAAACARRVA